MSIKVEEVHNFFNKTENYLQGNSTIFLRKLIVSEMINTVKGGEIIDIGCGNGYISIPYLESNYVTFLDLSENMLEEVKKNTPKELLRNAKFYNTDIENFNLKVRYDIILLIGVLAHVNNVEHCIYKISELIKKNGICIVQITDYDKLIAKFFKYYSHIRKNIIKPKCEYGVNIMNKDSIISIFSKYGFRILDEKRHLPSFPGFRFLNQEGRTKFFMKTYNRRFVATIGSELILKFIKNS